MDKVLAILELSDSFSELWPKLAESMEAELRIHSQAAALPASQAAAVLVAAGGVARSASPAVEQLRRAGATSVVVVGADGDHRITSALLRAGAEDYFVLPGDIGLLRAWASEQAVRAATRKKAESLLVEERERFGFSRLIGASHRLLAAVERARKVVPRGYATVLVTGETGTGKELFAQAIHYSGSRAAAPFVEINCAAIPTTLLESELFGYEKGAFTGAEAAKPGLFEVANGGTLFLDEIAELPLELQAKLLRVLDERRVRRLGAAREVPVDVRLIAATHADLAQRVRQGRFREDLLYRLNVIPIHLPPLRERGDDVILLAEHFLSRLGRDNDAISAPRITPEVRRALLYHPWPGNVRELRNTVERALVFGEWDIPPTPAPHEDPSRGVLPFPAPMEHIERAAARAMVERFGGNKSRAADALQISRKRLYALLGDGQGGRE